MKALLLPTLFLCFALNIVAFAQDAPKRAPRKTQAARNRLITIMGTIKEDGEKLTGRGEIDVRDRPESVECGQSRDP